MTQWRALIGDEIIQPQSNEANYFHLNDDSDSNNRAFRHSTHFFFYTVPRGGQIETCEEREELEAQRGTL